MHRVRGGIVGVAGIVGIVALTLVSAVGCALVDGRSAVGTLIASWSQGQDRHIDTITDGLPMVIADNGTRRAYLDRVSDELDTSAVRSADLQKGFLVLGSYGKCKEQSRVWLSDQKTAVEFEVYTPKKDKNTDCVWAPVTVDIWQIDRSELDSTPAERLQVRTA